MSREPQMGASVITLIDAGPKLAQAVYVEQAWHAPSYTGGPRLDGARHLARLGS